MNISYCKQMIVYGQKKSYYRSNLDFTYMSYLLLHNKLPPNSEAENNKYLLLHSVCGSEVWEKLSEMVLTQALSCYSQLR